MCAGAGEFKFPNHVRVSAEAQEFVRALIQINPSVRLTAAEALEHPWIKAKIARGTRMVEKGGKLTRKGATHCSSQRWTPGGQSSYLGVPISSLSRLDLGSTPTD